MGIPKISGTFRWVPKEKISSVLVPVLGSSHLRKLLSRSVMGITSGVVITAVGL